MASDLRSPKPCSHSRKSRSPPLPAGSSVAPSPSSSHASKKQARRRREPRRSFASARSVECLRIDGQGDKSTAKAQSTAGGGARRCGGTLGARGETRAVAELGACMGDADGVRGVGPRGRAPPRGCAASQCREVELLCGATPLARPAPPGTRSRHAAGHEAKLLRGSCCGSPQAPLWGERKVHAL
jgi:hypothetical protein